jgi:hypothetical protein
MQIHCASGELALTNDELWVNSRRVGPRRPPAPPRPGGGGWLALYG